jgi:hypothetical protein
MIDFIRTMDENCFGDVPTIFLNRFSKASWLI